MKRQTAILKPHDKNNDIDDPGIEEEDSSIIHNEANNSQEEQISNQNNQEAKYVSNPVTDQRKNLNSPIDPQQMKVQVKQQEQNPRSTTQSPKKQTTPKKSKKCLFIIGIAAIVGIIGLIVGLVIGLRGNNNQNTSFGIKQFYSEEPSEINVGEDSFNIGIGIQLSDGTFLTDTSYITVRVFTQTLVREEDELSIAQTNLESTSCSSSMFPDIEDTPIVDEVDFAKLFCLDQSATVQGKFSNDYYQIITVSVEYCDDETSVVACSEDIIEKLEGSELVLYHTEDFVNFTSINQVLVSQRIPLFPSEEETALLSMKLKSISVNGESGIGVRDTRAIQSSSQSTLVLITILSDSVLDSYSQGISLSQTSQSADTIIESQNAIFAFGIEHSQTFTMFTDNTIFYIQALIGSEIIDLSPCSGLSFSDDDILDQYEDYDIQNMLCISEDITIKSDDVLSIVIKQCDSTSEELYDVTCSDTIQEELDNSYLLFLYNTKVVGDEVETAVVSESVLLSFNQQLHLQKEIFQSQVEQDNYVVFRENYLINQIPYIDRLAQIDISIDPIKDIISTSSNLKTYQDLDFEPATVQISSSQFQIAFGANFDFLEVNAQIVTQSNTEDVELQTCSSQSFSGAANSPDNVEDLYCLSGSPEIEGVQFSEGYKYLSIDFGKCDGCATESEIEDELDGSSIQIYFTEDLVNADGEIEKVIKSIDLIIHTDLSMESTIKIFSKEIEEDSHFGVESITNFKVEGNEFLARVIVELGNLNQIIEV